MPALQSLRGIPERRDRFKGIEHAPNIIRGAAQMLAPQFKPEVTSVLAGAVSKARGVDRCTCVAILIEHRARDLGVVTP
jgi:hypothetical protein